MTGTNVVVKTKRKRNRVSDDPTRRSMRSASAKARKAGTACTKCNKKHEKNGVPTCNGHHRRARPPKPCMRPPIPGGEVCDWHGGQFPIVKANADRRVAWEKTEGEVGKLLRECDLPEQHPIDGLLEMVRHTGAMTRMLATKVAELGLDPGEIKFNYDDRGGVTRYTTEEDSIWGLDHTGDGAAHILVIMYGQWADRYARACKLALDANIDERLVRNAESTTEALYVAIGRALDVAKLTPEQMSQFGDALAVELRKLVGPIDMIKKVAG